VAAANDDGFADEQQQQSSVPDHLLPVTNVFGDDGGVAFSFFPVQ